MMSEPWLLRDVKRLEAEVERLRKALTHAAQALSGCVCSMADGDLMDEIARTLDDDDLRLEDGHWVGKTDGRTAEDELLDAIRKRSES